MMESALYLEKIRMPASRLNALDAKAQSSIKRHNVRGFINAGTGPSTANLHENDENSQLAEHLMQLKTSCSGVKVDIKHRELEQFKYKDETSFITERVRVITTERQKLEDEMKKVRGMVVEVKCKENNSMMACKSYEHMLDRMKKDEIRYQIKKNELEKDLRGLQKAWKELKNKNYDLKEFGFLSATGLKEAHSEIEELKHFRKTTLLNMSRVVDEKEVFERKKLNRKEKSDMIKEMAAGDLQDAELIQLKKFLSVQLFLKTLLKGKIGKLKEFYEPYEIAFLKIKGNTSVKDASSLKAEYQNFENSYNEKAAWVGHLEQEITKSEKTKKECEAELSTLRLKEMEILEKLEQGQGEGQVPFRQDLRDKAANSQIMMMSVREWLKQQSKKMRIQSANKPEVTVLREICLALRKKQEAGGLEKTKGV